jgi:hypothetical protein
MADGIIASGAVHSDVEGQRQNPELQMVLALMDLIDKPDHCPSNPDARQAVEVPVITWKGDGTQTLMNDYKDAEFFTGAFPALFPYGRGGHMPASDERTIPVSLEAWARWSLCHHSRRSVATCIMVYLLLTDYETGSPAIPLLCIYYTTSYNVEKLRLATPSL